jgi:xanthine dehydrogenase accessory factor
MQDIYQEILQELSQGRDFILATIINQKGSAPRTQGTKFLIRPDGRFSGTIGGGRLEADVLKAAPEVFQKKRNKILPFRLKGEEVAETEMICGGEVDVYLELFLSGNPGHQNFFREVQTLREQGREVVLATWVEDGAAAGRGDLKVIIPFDEEPKEEGESRPFWFRPLLEALPGKIRANQPLLHTLLLKGEPKKIFLEPLAAPSFLYVFGAGHISLFLCPLGKMVGFQVAVFDDRPEFANRGRFPEADEIVARPFEEALQDYPFSANGFFVIVTRGHLHDHQVLGRVLKKPHRYIGMIGSRHKRAVVFKALREEGVSEEELKTVHAPIGLDINGETPEEIAVSIAAELIQVRGQARGRKKNWKV